MPMPDNCHLQVAAALRKDGWTIVRNQVYFKRPDVFVFIDLEARKAESEVFVEVKCFQDVNAETTDLYLLSVNI